MNLALLLFSAFVFVSTSSSRAAEESTVQKKCKIKQVMELKKNFSTQTSQRVKEITKRKFILADNCCYLMQKQAFRRTMDEYKKMQKKNSYQAEDGLNEVGISSAEGMAIKGECDPLYKISDQNKIQTLRSEESKSKKSEEDMFEEMG